jgi:hypothetical protein
LPLFLPPVPPCRASVMHRLLPEHDAAAIVGGTGGFPWRGTGPGGRRGLQCGSVHGAGGRDGT